MSIFHELETNEVATLEMMFEYKLGDLLDFKAEELQATKDFHSGALDPNNKNNKYEQKQMAKKRREERQKRKHQDRVDFFE